MAHDDDDDDAVDPGQDLAARQHEIPDRREVI